MENGVLTQTAGTAPDCGLANISNVDEMLISVYPNPVSGNEITIEGLSQFNWIITDLQGKEYSTPSIGNQIDVSKLSNGVYFLNFSGDKKHEIVKLVIAR